VGGAAVLSESRDLPWKSKKNTIKGNLDQKTPTTTPKNTALHGKGNKNQAVQSGPERSDKRKKSLLLGAAPEGIKTREFRRVWEGLREKLGPGRASSEVGIPASAEPPRVTFTEPWWRRTRGEEGQPSIKRHPEGTSESTTGVGELR